MAVTLKPTRKKALVLLTLASALFWAASISKLANDPVSEVDVVERENVEYRLTPRKRGGFLLSRASSYMTWAGPKTQLLTVEEPVR
jgi:hypothetical protein